MAWSDVGSQDSSISLQSLELLELSLLQSLAIDLERESSSLSDGKFDGMFMFSVQSLPQLPLRPLFEMRQTAEFRVADHQAGRDGQEAEQRAHLQTAAMATRET